MNAITEVKIPNKCLFLLTEEKRYKVLYGGRGSGKSQSIARALILKALSKRIRILCTRQIQRSIKDSVHKVITDCINSMGLSSYFIITNDSIKAINGSEFIFKGLQANTEEIKSLQGVNICWCEEAENITDEAWDILIPTIREEKSEIWISFNPNMKSDPTYQRFVVSPPDNCISVKLNYTDNPFFPDVLKDEMNALKEINYPRYEHIWLGIPNSEAGNLIKIDKFKRYVNPPLAFDTLFICCDTAFSEKKSADDSAFMLMGTKGKDKYILDAYAKKVSFVDLRRDLKSFYEKAIEKYGKTSRFTGVYIENKASGISLIQQLRSEGMPVHEIYPTVHNVEAKKDIVADKYTRFLEIEAEIDSGFVWLPESAYWLPDFIVEAEGFKGGKQDTKDDLCFCAGTTVKTILGDTPIEKIKKGDYVITPMGLRKVLAIGNRKKDVFYNKTLKLLGTPNHKVLTYRNGYDNLCDVINEKDTLQWNLKNLIIWKIKSLLFLTEKSIAEWGERESISYLMKAEVQKEKGLKDCMLRYGSFLIKRKFRMAIKCIIKILTHLIATLIIWNVYHLMNICKSINKENQNMGKAKNKLDIWRKYGNLQKNGIHPKREENGTLNTQGIFWKKRKKLEYVKIAVKNLFTRKLKKMNPDTMDVGVKNVTKNIGKDFIGNYNGEKLTVFNLKVDGGVYFANNTLVSNCDSMIYCLKVAQKNSQTDWGELTRAFM